MPLSTDEIFQIERNDPDYPKLLKEIYDPPRCLFGRGKRETLNQHRWIAVVGARKATAWGLKKTAEIAADFLKKSYGIVSGLAYGIDAQAHKTALAQGGRTWGVLGSSLDRIYPSRHIPLAEKMTRQGGILSEFPMGTGPARYHFPQRNRIIAGMAEATVIVEAAIKSGALITAQFALEEGREVFVAVPPLESAPYAGNIKLLEEGAAPIPAYNMQGQVGGEWKPRREQAPSNDALLSLLSKPQSLEQIAQKTKQGIPEILAALTNLETLGKVRKLPGPLWQQNR